MMSSGVTPRWRRRLFLAIVLACATGAAAWGTLSAVSSRPLPPREAWTFGAAFVRATPAHFSGRNPLETLRCGGWAFGHPQAHVVLAAGDRQYVVPLPPRTTFGSSEIPGQFITFARPEELRVYLHQTLPRAGWPYREQLGSLHALGPDGLRLSVRSSFHAGTRIGELRYSLVVDR